MNANVNNHSAAFGWIGILAVTAFCVMWLMCYLADSSWTWGTNTLGDFGISATAAADYFNYGMIIVGMALAVYGLGKTQSCSVVSRVGGNLIALGGVAIALVGITTVDAPQADYHKLVALVGFFLLVLGLLLASVQRYLEGKVLAVGIAIVAFIVMFFATTQYGYAEGRAYALIVVAIWGLVDAIFMITDGLKGAEAQ